MKIPGSLLVSRWPLVLSFCALMAVGVQDSYGQGQVAETTTAEWYRLSRESRAAWLGGALGALSMMGLTCTAPMAVGPVADAMTHRYLSGAWKGTDLALSGVVSIMADHGCAFEEGRAATFNAALKAGGMPPSPGRQPN